MTTQDSERAEAHIEQAKQALAGLAGGTEGSAPAVVERLGVIGGGQMGAGIAATAVSRGLPAVVRDLSPESLDRARAYRDKVLAGTADRQPASPGGEGSGTGGEDHRASLWTGTTGWDGFGEADAIIEAVFELPDLKDRVLGEVGETVGTDTLIASNTSAIPIRTLAASVPEPERFIGMHFFSPVDRMPLVELIPHEDTAATTVTRAAALGQQLGKVGVVVGDAPGFCTSRVYARWLVEGIRLLLDGAGVEQIDAAAKAVGFPVGPLRAHDEATLNLVLQASITQVAEPVMADRLDIMAARQALQALLDAGVEGRRQGSGFYAYEDRRRAGANPQVVSTLGVPPADLDADVVGERLLLAFASECYLCWDDGTLCHPDDGDVAAVLGIGFPAGLGGPFHYADQVGADDIVARCEALDATAFPPGTSTRRLAGTGGRFHDEPRRAAPFDPLPEDQRHE